MSNDRVRVRFAPSPTGGLHLGGVRTVLYNYLFAKKNNGDFVLRIEDTDQSRYVPGAEEYILQCLDWCGLTPDESIAHGGEYGPYRQSERKEIYKQYALELIKKGHAYYAFDTPVELEKMREDLKASGADNLQYDHRVRMRMKNSLCLTEDETNKLLEAGTPHVIRIKVNPGEELNFTDLIRGEINFDTSNVDDKVLLKADGMPTYHLAVVVDDYLMKISHAFRGEEWLPSAPVHIMLWKYLFGIENMPLWAHLPLILKPDGNGKLSKRDGDRLGFPVYAMDWKDPQSGELTKGFKEIGFLPQAFNNLLAMLGWNAGTEQEIFSMEELIQHFSLERVHKGGAKFDFEKAKWYNHEWLKKLDAGEYAKNVEDIFTAKGINVKNDEHFISILNLVKDRCHLLTDFYEQAVYFFKTPDNIDTASIASKWNAEKKELFQLFTERLSSLQEWTVDAIENCFKQLATEKGIKPGELQLPLRVMLVGGKYGPAVFQIAQLIGQAETIVRIQNGISALAA